MTARDPLPFAPAGADVPTAPATPTPAPVQRRLFYDPPPSARPLRLVRPRPVDIGGGDPMDRVRERTDGSTVAVRVQRARDGAPAAWRVSLVASSRQYGAPLATSSRVLYAPTASAAVFAQAVAMQAFEAAYEAAAVRNPSPVLSILRPGEDEPRPVAPRQRDGHDDGASPLAAG